MDPGPLSLLTLRFTDPDAEGAYRRLSSERSLHLLRVAITLGCTLYALFGLLDLWVVPEALAVTWSIRAAVCLYLLGALATTYRAAGRHRAQQIGATLVLVTGLGIVAMVAVADSGEGAFYYAGLILVVVFSHGLLRLRFVTVSALTGIVIAAYVAVVVGLRPEPGVVVVNNLFFLLSAQVICMFVSYSLEHYGREVFHQTSVLNEQGRRLRVEDERKSRELEDVRALQLAMLPRELPALPWVEIAVHMRTATEVGGDFYDFHVADDGALTCVIGDAAGHGARAGAIVTGMKMLLTCLHGTPELNQVLHRASATFKQSGIPGMTMSLALLRMRQHTVEVAGAGMPPVLLCRAGRGPVMEVPLAGMPVGAMAGFPYRSHVLEVSAGDTLLMMSDGFPELLDDDLEVMGYERAALAFGETASRGCQDIIGHLVRTAEGWSGHEPPADDVTFVVLKVKAGQAARLTRSEPAVVGARPRHETAELDGAR